MPKLSVLDLKGNVVSDIELNEAVFGIEPHKQAMYDMIVLQRNSLRQGTHKVKNRSEVSGGGRKPWRQKGTGRARQGSIRAPQWRGGGIVFGPTPRSYDIKLNRKVRRLALRSILSQKVLDNEMIVVKNTELETNKTKEMVAVLKALNCANKTVFVVNEAEDALDNLWLAARNLQNVLILSVEKVNVYDVMNCDHVVFTESAAKLSGEVFA